MTPEGIAPDGWLGPVPPGPGPSRRPNGPMPGPVRAARVLLYLSFGLFFLLTVTVLFSGRVSGAVLLRLAWAGWPTLGLLALALDLHKGGPVRFWSLVGLEGVALATVAVQVALGDTRAGSQVILPACVLALVLTPAGRAFFLGEQGRELGG